MITIPESLILSCNRLEIRKVSNLLFNWRLFFMTFSELDLSNTDDFEGQFSTNMFNRLSTRHICKNVRNKHF